MRTDRHGVYAQAREGIVRGLVGVDGDFEVPKDANQTVDLTKFNVPQVDHSMFSFLVVCEDLSFISLLCMILLLGTSDLL